ncbi:hypothetical protein CEXT_22601 [Caerostris extrusa]|uniref:Uncharacterized protein n=1 Tax=Caerostris extrusa TaxID=172846 RepID=A0AAV4MLD1_CAEEX|nr:hypothetical protein CEXT_22601 [Caerostris extrusa]
MVIKVWLRGMVIKIWLWCIVISYGYGGKVTGYGYTDNRPLLHIKDSGILVIAIYERKISVLFSPDVEILTREFNFGRALERKQFSPRAFPPFSTSSSVVLRSFILPFYTRVFSADDEEVILLDDGLVVVIIASETNESRPVVGVSRTVFGRDGRFPKWRYKRLTILCLIAA